MEIFYLVIIIAIGYGLFTNDKEESRMSSYEDLGNGMWLTPKGFVNLNPGLSPEHKLLNDLGDIEEAYEESKYRMELVFAEENARYEILFEAGKKIDGLGYEEKLQWLEKWIAYTIDWYGFKQKDNHERELGMMSFEMFIAWEMNPYSFLKIKPVFRPMRGRIVYV